MSEVAIYGASDDLIEVDGDVPGCDKYNGEDAVLLLKGSTGELRVSVAFDAFGCWSVGVAPTDEMTKMLPVTISQEPRMDGGGYGYSARAVVSGVESVTYEGPNPLRDDDDDGD